MLNKLTAKALPLLRDLKTYWDKPRENEYLSNKQFIFYCLGGMGIDLFGTASSLVSFAANWFAGDLMGIAVKDFVTVGIIGTVVGYALIFMQPLAMLIYENHGKLGKREKRIMHAVTLSKIGIGLSLYFVPGAPFEGIIRGLPQIVANILFIGGLLDYLNWFIRLKFCAKHGRVKPFIVAAAVPSAVLISVIPFLPVQHLDYTAKLVILHAAFTLSVWFFSHYNNCGAIVQFLTQNTQERQRLLSFGPIIKGFLGSMTALFLPVLITKTSFMGHKFGGYEDLMVYKVFMPLIAGISLLGVLFMLPVKENLVEQKIERQNVHFFRGAKQVLQNKYLWIINISTLLAGITGLTANLITWWMMYDLRRQWATGLVMNLLFFGNTLGGLITPSITKRFDKRNVYVYGRALNATYIFILFALFKMNLMWVFIGFTFLTNIMNAVVNGIGSGLNADALDYYQWKTGERCDSISGVFQWITNPFAQAIAFAIPVIYQQIGYTNDWGVLYDTVIFNKLFTWSFYITFAGTVLSVIPYFFYDLTAEKHRKCMQDIRERARRADIAEIEKHREAGTVRLIDPELLKKYGYDTEGNPREELTQALV